MQYKIDQKLVKQLHAFVYGNGKEYFFSQSSDDQQKLLKMAVLQEIEPLFYQMLQDDLPETVLADFKTKYLACAVFALKNRAALKNFTDLLEKNSIRFALFKGADMAFSYYPNPALRTYCDWDVLIHPDDCGRAVAVLEADGFTYGSKGVLSEEHHHLPAMFKNGFCVELHSRFSQFELVDFNSAWKYLEPINEKCMQYKLSPELNLLQMTRHMAQNGYQHAPLVKFLLDTAYLLEKEQIDWQRLKKLAGDWQMPYPGDILSAWDEFFSADIIEKMSPDPELTAGYRRLFASLHFTAAVAPGEWDMQNSKMGKMAFVKRGLKRMTPAALRKKYGLPEQGAYCRLCWWYGFDLTRKFFRFVRYCILPDKNALEHRKLQEQLEKNDDKK